MSHCLARIRRMQPHVAFHTKCRTLQCPSPLSPMTLLSPEQQDSLNPYLHSASKIQDTQPTNFWNSRRVPEKKQLMMKFSKKADKCFRYWKDAHGIPTVMKNIHLQMLLHACILYVSKFSRPRLHYHFPFKKNIKERFLYKVQIVCEQLMLQMI